jgi:3-dehydroquinate synthase
MAEHIHVTSPGGDYDIHIEPGLLVRVREFVPPGKVAVVTNPTLKSLYGEKLVRSLPDAVLVMMPDGEQYKTLDTVAKLYSDFVSAGLDRSSAIIALGGGVVGDTAGFAAATYMRGIGLIQIPTSLLAMVDSSVGGKVGVDLPQGKNLVGAFKQPDVVLIDPNVLKTLPKREWRCGMAEVFKHHLLTNRTDLTNLAESGDAQSLMIRDAVQVKVDIVQRDPYEQNVRAHLNLGHTFAHAIEQVSGYQWLHGEAVGVGLLAAARLSSALGLCEADLVEQVRGILEKIGLPTRIKELDPELIYAAMATDKKWKNGRSRFVLLKGVGQPVIVEDVLGEKVMGVLDALR